VTARKERPLSTRLAELSQTLECTSCPGAYLVVAMDLRDELADRRDRTADARDEAAYQSDRRQDALDRRGDERHELDLASLFGEATSRLDRQAADEALSQVQWQAQVVASVDHDAAVQQQQRSDSLVVATENIRDALYALERGTAQGSPAGEVQGLEDVLRLAREAYQHFVAT